MQSNRFAPAALVAAIVLLLAAPSSHAALFTVTDATVSVNDAKGGFNSQDISGAGGNFPVTASLTDSPTQKGTGSNSLSGDTFTLTGSSARPGPQGVAMMVSQSVDFVPSQPLNFSLHALLTHTATDPGHFQTQLNVLLFDTTTSTYLINSQAGPLQLDLTDATIAIPQLLQTGHTYLLNTSTLLNGTSGGDTGDASQFTTTFTATPEPASLSLLALSGLAMFPRRRRAA